MAGGALTLCTTNQSRAAASGLVCPYASNWGDWDPEANYWADLSV